MRSSQDTTSVLKTIPKGCWLVNTKDWFSLTPVGAVLSGHHVRVKTTPKGCWLVDTKDWCLLTPAGAVLSWHHVRVKINTLGVTFNTSVFAVYNDLPPEPKSCSSVRVFNELSIQLSQNFSNYTELFEVYIPLDLFHVMIDPSSCIVGRGGTVMFFSLVFVFYFLYCCEIYNLSFQVMFYDYCIIPLIMQTFTGPFGTE